MLDINLLHKEAWFRKGMVKGVLRDMEGIIN